MLRARGWAALAPALIAAAGLAAGGCEAGDGDDGPAADARPPADAAIDGDAGPCTATAGGYGDVGTIAEAASRAELTVEGGTLHMVTFTGALNGDQDLLFIELIAGYGAFEASTSPTTGTFPLSGDELNFATCGVCVRVLGDVDAEGNVGQIFMATGGSLTVTALGDPLGQRFQATLTGATFEHVTIHPMTFVSTPVGDGCAASVDSAGCDVATIAATP